MEHCTFPAVRGPVVARALARPGLALGLAAAAGPAPVPRHGLCRGQDLVLLPKTRKNLTRHVTLVL